MGKKTIYTMRRFFCLTTLVLCFHRWSRRGHAAFRTIGQVVRIGVLPVVYTLCTFAAHAQTQADTVEGTMRQVQIDEVRVEQVQLKSLFATQGAGIEVLTGEELHLPAVATLEELLAHVPGLDVRQRGAHGVQGDIAIRGGGFDQVMILLNGVNLTDAQSGHHNLNLPIDPEAIARIEVLTGPSARLYGPGAFAGAINIVTKSPAHKHIALSAKAGEYGLREAFAASSYQGGEVTAYGFVSGATAEGYAPNTDFLKLNAFLSARVALPKGHLRMQAGHQSKDFGAQAFYSQKFPEEQEETRGSFISGGYSLRTGRLSLEAEAAYRGFNDHFQLFYYADAFRQQKDATGKPSVVYTPFKSRGRAENFHHTQIVSGRVYLGYTAGISTTKLALIHRYDNVLSRNLGEKIGGSYPIPGRDLKYTHYAGRNTSSVSFEEQLQYAGATLALGGMCAYSDHFGLDYGYGADLSYSWAPGASVYGACNSSFRYPTFTDLYYSDPAHKGNSSLHVEKALTTEMGLRYAMGMLHMSLAGYYRWGTDIIDWVPDAQKAGVFNAQNHYRCNRFGGEAAAGVYPKLPGLESVLLGYTYTSAPLGFEGGKGSYVYGTLQHHATLRVKSPIWRTLCFSALLDFSKRNGGYTDFSTKRQLEYPSALTLNLRGEYRWEWLTVFAEAHNVLGAEVLDFGGLALPGRWVSAGVRCDMHYGN